MWSRDTFHGQGWSLLPGDELPFALGKVRSCRAKFSKPALRGILAPCITSSPSRTMDFLQGRGSGYSDQFSGSLKKTFVPYTSVRRTAVSKISISSCACATNLGNRRRLAGTEVSLWNRHTTRKWFSKFTERTQASSPIINAWRARRDKRLVMLSPLRCPAFPGSR